MILQIARLAIALLLLCCFSASASASRQLSSDEAVDWHIIQYLEDPEHTLSADDALSTETWQNWPDNQPAPNFGFSRSAYWLKIIISNPAAQPVLNIFSLGTPWIDEIDLYLVEKQQLNKHWQMGDQRPYQSSIYKALNPEASITFPPGESTLFVRVATVEALIAPVSISTQEQSIKNEIYNAYYFGAFYGALILIAVYNLFLYVSIKSKVYLYYVSFVVAVILATATYNGILFHLLFNKVPSVATSIHPHLFYLYQYFGLLFVAQFLQIKKAYPRLHIIFKWFFVVLLASQVIFTLINNPYLLQPISVISSSLYGFFLASVGVYIFRTRGIASMLLSLGIFSSVIGTIITTLTVFSILPFKFFLFHAIEIGFLIDAALLSFALAANMKLLMLEKQQMQAALLEKESLKKQELEKLVKQRTDTLEHANEKLRRISVTDELTRLNNRLGTNQYLNENLELFRRYGKSFSLIMLDIDFFKKVNDQHGHQAGDQLLQDFARLIQNHTRSCDIAGRWGGEEFIIICPETSLESTVQLAEKLRIIIKENKFISDIQITTSIGLTTSQADDDQDSIISRADEQLYRAKQKGRDTICY